MSFTSFLASCSALTHRNRRDAGTLAAGMVLALAALSSARADTVVYDNISGQTPQYADPASNSDSPVFGDSLNLTQPGTLTTLGITLFNGGGGPIDTGHMVVTFYDNTTPYAGGTITNPSVGTGTINYDFTGSGGLQAGDYDVEAFDFSSLNISLPQNILITQQFFEDTGTSTSNGVVLYPDPTVGTSPETVFISDPPNYPAGLYSFQDPIASQFGYYIAVATPVPEPTALALLGFGAAALLLRRRAA